MRFLCDQMLSGLGKWLRIAGYDTLIIEEPLTDREVLSIAIKEDRILLTRDKHFLEVNQNQIVFLEGNAVEECARELKTKCNVNWSEKPFSRCSDCNEILKSAKDEELDVVDEKVRGNVKQFWICPKCKQIYWRGSHTDRMLKTLQSWNNSHFP